MKNTILFDIDGVLADFTFGYTSLARQMFPDENISLSPTRERLRWDFDDIRPEIADAVWQRIVEKPEFWGSLPLLVDDRDKAVLRDIAARNSLVYMTSRRGRPDKVIGVTKEWLTKNDLPDSPVLMVRSISTKLVIADNLVGSVVLIDDYPGLFTECANPAITRCLVCRPYNVSVKPLAEMSIDKVEDLESVL